MAEQPNPPHEADQTDAAADAGTNPGNDRPADSAFDPETDTDAVGLAEQALSDTEAAVGELGGMTDARNVNLPNFQQVLAEVEASGLNLLNDVQLHVKIELGRTSMYVEDVLKLAEGSVVELDKLAGDPVDVYVNERLVARGEVLVLNDSFCVRVSEIVGEEGQDADEDDHRGLAATETVGVAADAAPDGADGDDSGGNGSDQPST